MNWCRGKNSTRQMYSSSFSPLPSPSSFLYLLPLNSFSLSLMRSLWGLRSLNLPESLSVPFWRGRVDLSRKESTLSTTQSRKYLLMKRSPAIVSCWRLSGVRAGLLQSRGDLGTGQGRRTAFSSLVLYGDLMSCHWVNVCAETGGHTSSLQVFENSIQRHESFTYNSICIKNTLRYALSMYL